jgi:hypothetical protein
MIPQIWQEQPIAVKNHYKGNGAFEANCQGRLA